MPSSYRRGQRRGRDQNPQARVIAAWHRHPCGFVLVLERIDYGQ